MSTTPLPLRDIHLPEAISWWPLALGWWLLALLIPVLLVFAYRAFKRVTRKNAVKKALKIARKHLDSIEKDADMGSMQKLCELSVLIRRVAISVAPRAEVAGLTGRAWLEFLDNGLKDAPFSIGVGRLLVDAPYRKTPPTDPEITQLLDVCRNWLKTCARQKR
ncbi:DUF4381 domain-containing protein [Crenothrix polyspora]|jgi:Domain of unknown function (DUF4381)|uniref:DUF4381 domain-containing protein n=1 Tax=Crenothrix polyspora TaxID=360316 RepID=A0A1R4HHI8_9GAMM|nr:DUF4381 domain-containing protein [Crenothrix polyspora]SJM95679.1 conserved hypothetical protein [Crenothrix polyspora]